MSPAATSTPAELDSTGEIDAAWVESVLASPYPGVAVRSVAKAPIGAGNVSDTVQVTIEYARPPRRRSRRRRRQVPAQRSRGARSRARQRRLPPRGRRAIGRSGASRLPHPARLPRRRRRDEHQPGARGSQLGRPGRPDRRVLTGRGGGRAQRAGPAALDVLPDGGGDRARVADPDGGRLRLLDRGGPGRGRGGASALPDAPVGREPRDHRGRQESSPAASTCCRSPA